MSDDEAIRRRPTAPPLAPQLRRIMDDWATTRAATFTPDGDPRCLDCGGPAKRDGRHLCETCEGKRCA